VRVTVEEGLPAAVGQVGVLQVREEWRVFDRWWTDAPVRRRYFDLVLATGENVAIFEDEEGGGWFRQKA
jgi:acyl-coenzyme A synthetase/AMP-(fatty) acid ligase